MSFKYLLKLYSPDAVKLSRRKYHLPSNMKCLKIYNYANTIEELNPKLEAPCPTELDLKPDEALVKIHAASINPIDLRMAEGYGRNAMNLFRKQNNIPEFPMILGRDFSGEIVKRGKRFLRFQVGEPVYGVRWVVGQGTHAEYAIVNKTEICTKPEQMNFIEAASIPYVACTAWYALIGTGAVPMHGQQKRILVPGASGGVGSFAAQLCQAYGHDVITTCASDAVPLLKNIGLKNIIDYNSDTYEHDLRKCGPFDVILDTLNEKFIKFFQELLKPSLTSHYVTLRPSILPDTDREGLAIGLATAGTKLIQSNIQQLRSGKGLYSWGIFQPNGLVLNNIYQFIEEGKILPLVDRTFSIDDVLEAYRYVNGGHARGKTVITM